jgi:hypothetical protein
VLNQFSLAGYNGYLHYEQVLPALAKEKLARLLNNHRDLCARVTVPFASFVYFSADDNRFLNGYANSPRTVSSHMQAHDAAVRFLFLGEKVAASKLATLGDLGRDRALAQWQALYDQVDGLDYSSDAPVGFDKLQGLAKDCAASLQRYFPALLVRRIKPLKFYIRDLGMVGEFTLAHAVLTESADRPEQADILVNSQPLAAALRFPSGFETLAVSGRFLVQHNFKTWQWFKSLTILWNHQIYLRPRYLFNTRLLVYVAARVRSGLLRQMANKARIRAAAVALESARAEPPARP